MCNAYPRPRCSGHTWAKLQTEMQTLQTLLDEAKTHKRAPSSLANKIANQENRVALAQRQFNCTPRGLGELEEKIAQVEPAKDRLEYAHYQRSLEQARLDAANHSAAAKLYDAYRDKLDPSDDPEVMSARQKRNAIAAQIAYVSNQKFEERQKGVLERKYATFAKEEKSANAKFLLRQRGITHPSIEQSPSKQQEIYAYLPSREFGHLSKEFPQGAYAKITDINRTSEGNYEGLVEGVKPIVFPSSTPFIINKVG